MARTPKNFDGTEKTAKNVADLLPEILKQIQIQAGVPTDEIFRFWFVLIGDKMGPMTEPLSFENGALTVKVKSSSLYSLLCTHERARLLKELQKRFSVKNLIFRIG